MKKLLTHIALLWLIGFGSFGVNASELIVERSFYVDPTGQATFEDVNNQTFESFQNVLNRGYTKSVTWVRLVIEKPVDAYYAILRVRPNYLDEIELFSEDDLKSDLNLITGDRYPKTVSNYVGKDQGFWIQPAKEKSIYYLRVDTTSTTIIFPEAMTAGDMKEVEAFENLIFGFYLGLMTWILLWAISTYLYKPESILAGFIGYQLLSILLAISFMGYLRMMLPSNLAADKFTSNIVLTVAIAAFFFHRNFILQYKVPKIFRWILMSFFLFTVINTYIGNFIDTSMALKANAIFILLAAYALTLIVITINLKKENRNWLVLFTYLMLSLVMFISQAIGIGIIPAVELGLNTALLHGLIAGVLIYFMMYDRAKRKELVIREQQERAIVITKELEAETTLREAQSAFIALLIHELKSPIAVVKLAIASMIRKLGDSVETVQSNLTRLETAADDMNVIIERCIEVQKVDTGSIPVYKKPVDIPKVIWTLVRAKDRDSRIELPKQDSMVIQTDEDLVKVVLLNLVENALKYAVADSKIQITLWKEEKHLLISFQNQVDKLAMPVEDKVFQKFYRSEESKRHRGSGLGLWLSKEMAELIGGQLNYRAVGNTVIFEFLIPNE